MNFEKPWKNWRWFEDGLKHNYNQIWLQGCIKVNFGKMNYLFWEMNYNFGRINYAFGNIDYALGVIDYA